MSEETARPAFFESDMGTVKRELDFLNEYGDRDDIPRLALDVGDTKIRILPAFSDRGRWSSKYGMHWNLPIPGDQKTFRCAQMQDEPAECLFCEGAETYRTTNPDLYKRWMAKPRFDFNVIDVDSPELGVLLLSLAPTVAQKIFESADKYGDPSHPETGYNFTITKKKTGSKPYDVEYSVWPDRESTELEDWSVLENLHLLDEIFPAPSLEAQQKSLQLDTAVGNLTGLIVDDDIIVGQLTEGEKGDQETASDVGEPAVSARDLLRNRLLEQRA